MIRAVGRVVYLMNVSLDGYVADRAGEALPKLREEFAGDISVGGPSLAAGLISKGLVDEFKLVVHPVILGGGTVTTSGWPPRWSHRRADRRLWR
jgi:dihydrofolate reductase